MSDAKSDSSAAGGTASHRLRESVVKDVLEKLDWGRLKEHLDDVGMNEAGLAFFLGHLRRTTKLILKYPDTTRERQRAKFIRSLNDYVSHVLGSEASASLSDEIALLDQIERVYRGILEILDQSPISELPADVRAAACISRAAHQYDHLSNQIHEAVRARDAIMLPGTFLATEEGARANPDAVLNAIVNSVTTTLVMEARRNNWIGDDGCVVLPLLPAVGDEELFKAGTTEVLAMTWRGWCRTEERRRFLGGAFDEHSTPNLPSWAPEPAQRVTVYEPQTDEIFDHIANERLNDRFAQTLMSMLTETNIEAKVRRIRDGAPLLPGGFVSVTEAHGAVSLREILCYDIFKDEGRPGGLRIVEWLRGFAALRGLTEERNEDGDDPTRLTFVVLRDKLLELLEGCGLEGETAGRFIDLASLRTTSRDLFDCPLIRMEDDSLIVFGPALLAANPALVVLSAIGTLDEPLARKGKGFERTVCSFFTERGFLAKSFKVTREGEEYEYDVVLAWGDYVFVFECKNYGLSAHHPVQSYYFGLKMRKARAQVKRLGEALTRYPELLREQLEIDVAGKAIVPCVLNALPYAVPGQTDGVYVTDFSSLRRFFEERYFHIKAAHEIGKKVKLLHRVAMRSSWAGEEPSPEDLVGHLDEPFQVMLMAGHTTVASRPFWVGTAHLVVPNDFARTEMSIESYADVVGVSAESIQEEMTEVARLAAKSRSREGEVAAGEDVGEDPK